MLNLTFDEASHKYYLDGRPIPGVNEILDLVGLQNHWGSEADMMRGTYIHQACQYYDEGTLDEKYLDPIIRPYLDGWKKFRLEKNFEPELIETSLFSQLGFAGRIDRYGLLDGYRAVVDIKSGDPGWITGLKLAGYEILAREWLKTDPSIIRRVAIRLYDTGDWKPYYYTDYKEKEIFLNALSVVIYKRNKERR